MRALLAVPFLAAGFHGSVQPLPSSVRADLIRAHYWRPACPVGLGQLRLLNVSYVGFDGRSHPGQLVVRDRWAGSLVRVFRRLYTIHFRIRVMTLAAAYGPNANRIKDASSGFDCRFASASPCSGRSTTGNWSEHAYGEAIDLNPIENPYVGTTCGRTRQRASIPYLNRSRLRRGMVTSSVVRGFRAIGWGWGGAWTGTKDYMHFSASGH